MKLPKCDTKHETDFKGPEELMKKLSLPKGGDAYVLHGGKFWDYQCKKMSNPDEDVIWSSGPYFFRLECSCANIEVISNYQAVYGQGEAALAAYLKAIGK